MTADPHESVTHWLRKLESDDDAAAQQQLWDRYFERLTAVARTRLGGHRRESDEEDVALSVFHSFFRAAREGRYPKLTDRTGLWPLLVTITARKSINAVRRQNAQKRSAAAEEATPDLGQLMGREPSPQFAAEIAEQVDQMLGHLEEELRGIAIMKLEGYENREIAAKLGIVERSVSRKLARIRSEWTERADAADERP